MDLFKRALFAGKLDAPPFEFGEARNHPSNWLLMEIEMPKCSLPFTQAALSVRPKQFYGVNRGTVASVLLAADALPGRTADWERLFNIGSPDCTAENGFSALAAIPFRDFHERGRQELEAIIAPRAKLALWFEQRGWHAPAFRASAVVKARGLDAVAGPELSGVAWRAPDARPPCRPQKPAWPRVVQLVRQLMSEHPDWQKKRLAFEAWSRGKAEFNESELPQSQPSSGAWSKF